MLYIDIAAISLSSRFGFLIIPHNDLLPHLIPSPIQGFRVAARPKFRRVIPIHRLAPVTKNFSKWEEIVLSPFAK